MHTGVLLIFAHQITWPLKRFFKILRYCVISLISVILLLIILINLPPVQQFIAGKLVNYLSKKLGTRVELKHLRISLLNSAEIEGLYIEDKQGDTLLYAGALQLRASDWLLLSGKPKVTFLGLRNAYARLYRPAQSDRWNYQFVLDAFAGKESAEKSGESDFNLSLDRISLRQVRFHMVDQWVGSDMIGELRQFDVSVRDMDLKKRVLNIASVQGEQVTFGLRDYKGGRPASMRKITDESEVDTTAFNPGLWKIDLANLDLSDSRFFLDDPDTKPIAGYFDETHLDITGINIKARKININGDTLTGKLALLQARERCGLEIKKMQADVTVSPNLSECRNLLLQTRYSTLTDYYAMRYERFPDFIDYITAVTMVANLKKSEVGIRDIVYFAPALERFADKSVVLSGRGRGTVADLRVQDLVLNDGWSSLRGRLVMKGLPDIESTFIDFQEGHLQTMGPAVFAYVPELRNQQTLDFSSLSQVDFKGSFTGYIADFVTKGTLVTNIGTATADFRLSLPQKSPALYKGSLRTRAFDMGRLFAQPVLGPLTMDAKIEGRGFDAATAVMQVDAYLDSIMLNGYGYKSIDVKGLLGDRKFDGTLHAADPNLKLAFEGNIDFSAPEPLFDLEADIEHLNAKAIRLSPDSITASGKMRLSFTGTNIDNYVGSAYVYNMDIVRDTQRLNIDSLRLISRIGAAGEKLLRFSTNAVSVDVNGHFSLMDLPGSVQMFLSYYLPQYIKRPERVNEQQDIAFEIQAANTDDILSLFSPSIRVGADTRLSGTMDMRRQFLSFNGTVPYIIYDGIRFNDIQVSSAGSYTGFGLEVRANGIKYGMRDLASTVQFQTQVYQDTARFQLFTTTPTSIGSAELNGLAFARNDSFILNILPSEFFLNQARWDIPGENILTYSKDYLNIDNLVLSSGLQRIAINPKGSQPGPNKALVDIQALDILPFNRLFGFGDLNLDGRVNGQFTIVSLLKDQRIAFDLNADQLRINEDTLGNARAKGSYDVASATLSFDPASGLRYAGSEANVSGTYVLNKTSTENVNLSIELNDAQIKWGQPFLFGYVHKLSGALDGKINIRGNASSPHTSGTIQIKKVGFSPDITGAHYTIEEGTINVSDTRFEFGSIKVVDDEGRVGYLGGNIQHERLGKMNFRLNLKSDNIQVLDLEEQHNANFYGNVKASVQARLSGPVDNLSLSIFATPQKNSHLYIPISSGTDMGEYDYIHFRQYGEASVKKETSKSKLNIRLDAIATPDLEATIIIDPSTGDQIWAKGSGNIILEIPADGEIKMNGNYIIDEGKYNFSFKQLQVLNYKRQFTINSNSVIKWNGDIANADLDVTAYAQIRARLYDLIINEVDRVALSKDEIRDAQIMQMINVGLNMRGSLSEPDFTFRLDLVENRSVGTYAYQKLQRINTDDKELLNQVASLLLLEQFVPPEGLSNSNAVASGTINNMSELISTTASSQITNFANKILGMEDLYVGVRYKNYSLSSTDDFNRIGYINRNEAGINLRKSFLKNRLVVEVGGVYDWGRNASQSDLTTNLVGDFRVQYLFTEDGRIRFNVFRASNYDAIGAQTIGRQGVGLSYRRSFNGLLDLFRSQEKMRKEREERLRRQQPTSGDVKPVDSFSSVFSFNP